MTSWMRMFSWGFLMLAMAGLYTLKLNVKDMQDQIADLDSRIAQRQESLHVLKAEMAYLTRPERLSALQKLYFPDMKPVAGQQMTAWLPVPPSNDPPPPCWRHGMPLTVDLVWGGCRDGACYVRGRSATLMHQHRWGQALASIIGMTAP